jgi:hypothetical protein
LGRGGVIAVALAEVCRFKMTFLSRDELLKMKNGVSFWVISFSFLFSRLRYF